MRILIIEDQQKLAHSMKKGLEGLGYAVDANIAYNDLFDRVYRKIGIRTIYSLSEEVPTHTESNILYSILNKDQIMQSVPDYTERMYYISGPHAMVNAFESILLQMGIPRKHIKVDFFPSFA